MRDAKRIILALSFVLALLLPLNAYAFFGLFEDSNITLVKGGTFNFDKSVSIGNVLETQNYLYNQEWTSFEDSQKRKIVQCKANIRVNLIEKYADAKSTDIMASVLSEKSVYKEYIDDTKLVLQFVIYENDQTFDLAYCGLEGKGQEIDTRIYNATRLLKEIYANEMPYKLVIFTMLARSYVIDSIAEATKNFTQTFHQLTVNSDLAFEFKNDYSVFADSQRWNNLGIDPSRSYFKISNLTYDTIELETTFFLTPSSSSKKNSNVYEYTIKKTTFPITAYTYKNPREFRIDVEDGDLKFFIRKGAMRDEIYAQVRYSDNIDGTYCSATANTFVCNESAKQNMDIGWATYYGVYMGKDKESGNYLFEEGTGDEISLASKNTSLLDNSHIGRPLIIKVAKDTIISVEEDGTFKPEYYSFEGIAVEITDNYWVLQSDDGTKYQFNINHGQAYDVRRTLMRNQYQYVEGKGFGLVGYQGRIISGTWRLQGFVNWLYDPKTGGARKVNFATQISGPHEKPSPDGANNSMFVRMKADQ